MYQTAVFHWYVLDLLNAKELKLLVSGAALDPTLAFLEIDFGC
jgi:hypothetical protein